MQFPMQGLFIVLAVGLLTVQPCHAQTTSDTSESTTTTTPYYQPGMASWLGGQPGWDETPSDYQQYFPLTYVVFGDGGVPHVRQIVEEEEDCPLAAWRGNGTAFTKVDGAVYHVRANGELINNNTMPYRFPVQVCSIVADNQGAFRQALNDGNVVLTYNNQTFDTIPLVKFNPSRFLLTGDTGLRSKPTNLGLGKLKEAPCDAPEVYGVEQCYLNFTKEDLTQDPTGSFQGTDEWVFKELADDAATNRNPDVIVYVGDYLYRQGPCPANATDSMFDTIKNCSGINLPPIADLGEVPRDLTINFIPGNYGDNWWGWWADFFWPALQLLQKAPLIPTRGNHEICTRGGYGYFFFLSPRPLCPSCSTDLETFCQEASEPLGVTFEKEQFVVMDDSLISPLGGGIDHFIFNEGKCPGPPASGERFVATQEVRDDDDAQDDVTFYSEYMQTVEQLTSTYDTNFYVGHRPLFGVACNDTQMAVLDWTLQQALGTHTLDRVSAVISGHMHWFEYLQFADHTLPTQLVVGHGGTQLIPNYVNQSTWSQLRLEVGNVGLAANVDRGLSVSQFGYAIMSRNEEDNYEVELYFWNPETGQVEPREDAEIKIPKGPRVETSSTSHETSGTETTTSNSAAWTRYPTTGRYIGCVIFFQVLLVL